MLKKDFFVDFLVSFLCDRFNVKWYPTPKYLLKPSPLQTTLTRKLLWLLRRSLLHFDYDCLKSLSNFCSKALSLLYFGQFIESSFLKKKYKKDASHFYPLPSPREFSRTLASCLLSKIWVSLPTPSILFHFHKIYRWHSLDLKAN